jgi:Ca2+-binding EF-hand superfamily protein
MLPNKAKKAFKAAGVKERKSVQSIQAGVLWRMKLFDKADVSRDGKLDKKEFIEYYRFMEEKLRNEMGGAYHLTEEELNESHAAHDFDGSGFITKDEVLWSRKMKGKFYKSMRLTKEMSEVFLEDLNLFLALPANI